MIQPRRDWSDANGKRGPCRLCRTNPTELAHVIGREHDTRRGSTIYVDPDSVVPLCGPCHSAYDRHEKDLFFALRPEEIKRAVEDARTPARMLRRTAPLFYREANRDYLKGATLSWTTSDYVRRGEEPPPAEIAPTLAALRRCAVCHRRSGDCECTDGYDKAGHVI